MIRFYIIKGLGPLSSRDSTASREQVLHNYGILHHQGVRSYIIKGQEPTALAACCIMAHPWRDLSSITVLGTTTFIKGVNCTRRYHIKGVDLTIGLVLVTTTWPRGR